MSFTHLDEEHIKKVDVRVDQQIKAIPRKLEQAICTELGLPNRSSIEANTNLLHLKVNPIHEDEGYSKHYAARIETIHKGVVFLLDALPASHPFRHGKQLKKYLSKIADDYKNHLNNINQNDIHYYQNSLTNYVAYITEVLQSELAMNKSDVMHQLERAEEFAIAKEAKPCVCTIMRLEGSEDEFIVMIDQPQDPFYEEIKQELLAIQNNSRKKPDWFSVLKEYEKNYIKTFLKDRNLEKELGSVTNALSSKLRIIPVPSNYGKHTLITYTRSNGNAKLVVHPPQYRSSHAASRDIAKQSQSIRDTHTVRNLRKMVMDAVMNKLNKLETTEMNPANTIYIPILYQTLISPIITITPDYYLNQDKKIAVEQVQGELNKYIDDINKTYNVKIHCEIFSTNHPLNYGKYLDPTTPSNSTGKRVKVLVEKAEKDPRYQNGSLLKAACIKLKYYTTSSSSLTKSYRELHLSSLEQLVTAELEGISIGSCVSGKDRKAVEIAHTDAMRVFFQKYGKLPAFGSTKNEKVAFAKLFAEIYCSKHQQALASQNAPGSFGTKTPDMYLPPYLIKAVHEWYQNHSIYQQMKTKDTLKESDIMASNNELNAIKSYDKMKQPGWQSRNVMKRNEVYGINEHTLPAIFTKTDSGIQTYLKTGRNRMGFFAKHFGWSERKRKAECIDGLLNDKELSSFQKSILLFAVLTKMGGKTLQNDIVKALGFSTKASAYRSIRGYIRATSPNILSILDDKVTKIVELVERTHAKDLKNILQTLSPKQLPQDERMRFSRE